MTKDPIITRQIAALPDRSEDAHKGDVGRIVVIGGCCDESALMVGAAALTANAALRSGAGLVQLLVPEPLRAHAATLAPCATTRTLPTNAGSLLAAVEEFRGDVAAIGPGLGESIKASVLVEFLSAFGGGVVVDADGLNLLASVPEVVIRNPDRMVLTPHPGEMRRLLSSRGETPPTGNAGPARHQAAGALVEAYGCTIVLKGRGTVVTNGQRLYINETGNAGMATAGAGDVLTGMIAALMGQHMPPLEAAILGVYLHGLAGDFAAEELGRWGVTASDLVDYLPEAFCEHQSSQGE